MQKKMKVLQYALPRSGSSMIQQILRELPLKDYYYSHDFIENCDWPIISTLRDFRDVFISHWRIWHGEFDDNGNLINSPTEEQIVKILYTIHNKIVVLNTYKEKYKEKILWLKYEKFYNNHEYIFNELEKFLDIKISKQKRKEIIKLSSLETNKKRQELVPIVDKKRIFNNVGEEGIHANHISPVDSKPGYWKKIVNQEFQYLIEESLSEELRRWGYK